MSASWASAVLDLVRSASSAAEAEVVVDQTDLGVTRFANSYIHQNVAESITAVRLRLHLDGRTTTGSTTVTDGDGLRAMVERTVAATRLAPADSRWAGLTEPTPVPTGDDGDEATAAATPDERAARVRAFVDAARGLEAAGYCHTIGSTSTFANSAGHMSSARATEAAMDAIARDAGSDGLARLSTRRLSDLDGAILGERAARKARAGRDPIELPPGGYEVVLEPAAVADLLLMIAIYGLNGKAVEEGRSFVELGADQFDPAISLVDDPTRADGIAFPFDVEGTPRGRTVFVESGVSRAVAHDRRTAARAGTRSTGHALAGGADTGAIPMNLELVASSDPSPAPTVADSPVDSPVADGSVAELVAAVGRGLLVTDNWYTRVLDPRTLVVTGLTRNGLWLIEDGVATRPVQNLRFTQSYPRALAPGAVLGVGAVAPGLPASWTATLTHRAPALRLAAWNYTGNASG